MKAINNFKHALGRTNHLLELYNLLHNTRKRSMRAGPAAALKNDLGWPKKETIIRVDGKGNNSVLLLKGSTGIKKERFTHQYLSEILRAALVATVSAMDRYFHDAIMDLSLGLLSKKESDIPAEFKKIHIPLLLANKAVKRLKENSNARPRHVIKQGIQDYLHKQHTFQGSAQLCKALKMMGVQNPWDQLEHKINLTKNEIITLLDEIANRRNQIVHEADLVRKTSGQTVTLREISLIRTKKYIGFIENIVESTHEIVNT